VLEPVWYWTKLMQSSIFLFWYRTEIIDTGIQMPVLVSSMLMPSFVSRPVLAVAVQVSTLVIMFTYVCASNGVHYLRLKINHMTEFAQVHLFLNFA
jgi:hypothetical protein